MNEVKIIAINAKRIINIIDTVMSIDGYMYFACPEGRPVANRKTEPMAKKSWEGRKGSPRNFGRKPR